MRRILVSGLSGGSGKTIVSLGLARFFANSGIDVRPFKKGPDYIDAAWLMQASRRPCYCLDPFFLSGEELRCHFWNTVHPTVQEKGMALIEGNRGIFDGMDHLGSCSSAHLAHILDCPVLLTVNCTKMSRTAAALVMGIQHFDPKLKLAGIILNNIASSRHGSVIRKSIEEYTDVPVLGILPRQKENPIPERHLGLSLKDFSDKNTVLENLAALIKEHTDTDAVLAAAEHAPETCPPQHDAVSAFPKSKPKQTDTDEKPLNIAYLYDDAFWFYYQENFDALQALGGKCIPLSLLSEKSFAEQLQAVGLHENDIDGLYIGGGYPELFAQKISQSPKLAVIRGWIENTMPVYAECGGFMLLAKTLHCPENGKYTSYPMAGIFDIETKFLPKPQGLGYTEAKTVCPNPFHPLNSIWKGHEFHFSAAVNYPPNQHFLLRLDKGRGMAQAESDGKKHGLDGLLYKNCYASYTHLYAPAVPHFAENFIQQARLYREKKQ